MTSENVEEYIRLRKVSTSHAYGGHTAPPPPPPPPPLQNNTILGKRTKWLNAMRKGFLATPFLQSHLALFSVHELMGIICGSHTITAEALLSHITFSGFSRPATGAAEGDAEGDGLEDGLEAKFRRLVREMVGTA